MRKNRIATAVILVTLSGSAAWVAAQSGTKAAPPATPAAPWTTVAGMPAVADRNNLYSETAAGHMSPAVAGALERVISGWQLHANRSVVTDPR